MGNKQWKIKNTSFIFKNTSTYKEETQKTLEEQKILTNSVNLNVGV